MDPESTEHIHALPLYQLGFHDGRDVGLRIALDAIVAERIRQTTLQDTYPGNEAEAFRHAYAAARLVDVSKVIGARFRQ
jgi:antitoxin component of MazEF toxin-antitoxin module